MSCWADTFSNGMDPNVARAAATVLDAAGYRVVIPDQQACCGLTWITTGQLDGARARLLRLLEILGPYAEQGIPIVGLEPSCTAVLRSDLVDLLPDDPRAEAVSGAVRTLAELLTGLPDGPTPWRPPNLSGRDIIVQPHCHHHSVLGFTADRQLLTDSGATLSILSGCCGLAGNFGMERGHYEISVAVAENALLPALRSRSADTSSSPTDSPVAPRQSSSVECGACISPSSSLNIRRAPRCPDRRERSSTTQALFRIVQHR